MKSPVQVYQELSILSCTTGCDLPPSDRPDVDRGVVSQERKKSTGEAHRDRTRPFRPLDTFTGVPELVPRPLVRMSGCIDLVPTIRPPSVTLVRLPPLLVAGSVVERRPVATPLVGTRHLGPPGVRPQHHRRNCHVYVVHSQGAS